VTAAHVTAAHVAPAHVTAAHVTAAHVAPAHVTAAHVTAVTTKMSAAVMTVTVLRAVAMITPVVRLAVRPEPVIWMDVPARSAARTSGCDPDPEHNERDEYDEEDGKSVAHDDLPIRGIRSNADADTDVDAGYAMPTANLIA
jgi:hypothetical protein